ncbi:DNA-binding protein [Streptomyces sp. NPDC088197]|uniref:DNA-binding protein n=1 Tax=Streptomyces sp. NPDC088197 TaxID=3365840 RepID=UPI00380797AA
MKERSYPKVMKFWGNPPVATPDEEWVSQPDAAKILGISMARVVWRIMSDHLTPAHNSAGRAGITRSSIVKDQQWLAAASWRAKSFRMLKDIGKRF